jgi:hypothetical protein
MNEKFLLLTFDYELFLGKNSGNVNDCILRPTNELRKILNKYNAKGIFFVDTMYLFKCFNSKHEKLLQDYHSIIHQLTELISEGHYVFPHIHPHWLDASYSVESGNWNLGNLTKYRFHSISDADKQICFSYSVNLINDLYRSLNRSLTKLSYRAGGWSIQPFEDFKEFFLKYNIHYDMSVIPGIQMNSNAQIFDFMHCPDKFIYRFENDVTKEELSGTFYELTISRIQIHKILYFISKVYYKIFPMHFFSRGNAVDIKIFSMNQLNHHNKILYKTETASLDNFNYFKIAAYKKHLEKYSYLHLISHPKMLSKESLVAFDIFLNKVFHKFNPLTDYQDIISRLTFK